MLLWETSDQTEESRTRSGENPGSMLFSRTIQDLVSLAPQSISPLRCAFSLPAASKRLTRRSFLLPSVRRTIADILRSGPLVVAVHMPSSTSWQKMGVLASLLRFAVDGASATDEQNPRDNFCRRYGHQTTFIDDKLYIDGGFVNFDTFRNDHKSYPSR